MSGKLHLVLPGLFDLPLSELAPDLVADKLPGLNRILRLANTQPTGASCDQGPMCELLDTKTSAQMLAIWTACCT